MKKNEFEEYINIALSNGADFAEIYYEESIGNFYQLIDSKLDTINTNIKKGIGIRIRKGENILYTSTNNLSKENIINLINKLTKNFKEKKQVSICLDNLKECSEKIEIPHNKYSINEKKDFLYKTDQIARNYSKLVSQVSVFFNESDREYTIANSEGKFIKNNKCLTRFGFTVYVKDETSTEEEFRDYAAGKGYEMFEQYNLEENVKKATETAIKKLDAKYYKGGEIPVIISNGFGAVIFHEACGHGLEATSVVPNISVFSNMLNKKVASDKVTLIDDGTIPYSWGGTLIDDEGNETQKNILIENGILKNYLIDNLNSKNIDLKCNGCGRREDYNYSPTSRMSNTYLAPGNDKIEDMIKSIKEGIYCLKMSGGSVDTSTGDFNFAVETARLIKNGKLEHYIKGVSLIGNSKEILKNVEMVSDDLVIDAGYCGSKSGLIKVTIGQPTIKVSKILVGGKE